MVFDGLEADGEDAGDGLGRVAFGDEFEDFVLAGGENIRGWFLASA
jgi:hypothetical protein